MDKVNVFFEPLRAMLLQVGQFLPKLAIAMIVLVVGWLLAKLALFAVVKALRAINFHVLSERAGIDRFLRQGGLENDITGVFGVLVYWLVILAALIVAFNGLGLTYVTDLLGKVALFVPKVIVALLILAFGAYFARFIGSTVTAYCGGVRMRDGELLGRLAQYAIIAFVVLIAFEQVNIGADIIRQSFLIVLSGIVLALALAFGLGGREWAAAMLERWWPSDRGERG
ncbi:MAG: hypothetical protein OEW21_03095 [Betaproteobacteria bacterium]|nr:hypothetical protein [Betaproteobacteria bacterium]